MHFPLQLSALTLLGSLTLTLAEQETDLGYLETTSFPSCGSSYKLDCFCEANAQLEAARTKENRDELTSASASTALRVELAPEVEELCAENGVPKGEIAKYLCDDTAVPASPRRGSTPMVRMGQEKAEEAESESESECGSAQYKERDDEEAASIEALASKRSISPGSARLLIPENDSVEREVAVDDDDDDDKDDQDDEGDRMASTDAIYEVVTVTETRTECSCAKTATPVHGDEDEENNTHMDMSGAMHGTQIAVAILPTPSQMSAAHAAQSDNASASVRVASSNVPVPTGVDAQQKHGANEDGDAEMFEGTADVVGVSRGVVLGLFGVAIGFVLL
ncbi:hypothetical protein BDW72DRAFT_213790 [Aspergillus terricola var. indicus]